MPSIKKQEDSENTPGESLNFHTGRALPLNKLPNISRHVLRYVSDPVEILNSDFRVIWLNKARADLHRKSIEDMVGEYCYKMYKGRSQICDECPAAESFHTGRPCVRQHCINRSDKETIWIECHTWPVPNDKGEITCVVNFVRDITAHRKAQEALSREAEINAAIAELTSSLLFAADGSVPGLVLEYAKRLTKSEFGFVGHIDPDSGYLVCPTFTQDVWNVCRVENKSTVFKEFKGLWGWVLNNRKSLLTNSPGDDPRSSGTPKGHVPIRRFLGVPALADGKLIGQIAVANADLDYTNTDLTFLERLAAIYAVSTRSKQAEKALRESEERYRALFNISNDAVFVVSVMDGMPGRFVEVNDMACQRLKYSREELLRLSPADIDAAEVAANIPEIMKQLAADKHALFEAIHTAKHGTEYNVEINARLFDFRGALRILAVARDVTERKALQSQLMQSQKLESIGQLAAGVAHEINNPVGFINSNLTTLNEYRRDLMELIEAYNGLEEKIAAVPALSHYTKVCEKLKEIREIKNRIDLDFLMDDLEKVIIESREGTERVKKIVQDLKDFSHMDQAELRWADLNKGIESTLNIAWNEIKYKAKVTKTYGELPEVYCYPQQVNQVFMNVLVNAAQAIVEKGAIKIVTACLQTSEPTVEIRISDTGTGISPENLGRLFDPFFTTKPVGKGTGLGLSMAYNIIKKHDGIIKVESQAGKGTTFIIQLPVNGPREKTSSVSEKSLGGCPPLPSLRSQLSDSLLDKAE